MCPSDDPTPAKAEPIAAALRHLKDEVLFAFGAEGDECIQALVATEGRLPGRQMDIFRAFHAGLSAPDVGDPGPAPPAWADQETLRPAYETGRRAMRLNRQRRQDSRMNVGPLDMPGTALLLSLAADALRS